MTQTVVKAPTFDFPSPQRSPGSLLGVVSITA